ncbi:MAG: hypothetical protein J0H71_05565 [Rhizobiales bacterium]|nr:hypothetical protein [Hyphomicrobiales bacterium]
MAAANKFNQFVEDVAEKVHNLQSDTLKVMLTNTAPIATNAVQADIAEIAAANGYTAGGTQSVQASSAQVSGTYKLVLADVTYTASAGSIGPFRYPVLYNDTPTSPADPLILFWDYGASITLTDGNSFTVDFSATNGVLTLA